MEDPKKQVVVNLFLNLEEHLIKANVPDEAAIILVRIVGIVSVVVLAWLANWIAKRIIIRALRHVATRSRTSWDDVLVKHRVFVRLSHFAPAVVIYMMAPMVFVDKTAVTVMQGIAQIYMILMGWFVIDAFLNAAVEIYRTFEFSRRVPIRGFIQVAKILLFLTGLIVILSVLLKKDPTKLLTGMGAMTAILMLVFKDSILGFVAGIQLSINKMVHIGDWIEMPKFGADGDIIDISLTTVKVQNWDKTISTIPAYALISDSFKNWRGMQESQGRRIKRNICIDMNSICFCDPDMVKRFQRFQCIEAYIAEKRKEIETWNQENKVNPVEQVNGRRLTNIGTFRAYLVAYLKNHPHISSGMTFLVRHLEPTAQGLPIQIYVFSSDKVWANYEAIQADIFDHILAVIPEFGLRVYQQPSGADLQNLSHLQ
jgi:miniconductance mechanosensitive channel